MKVKYIFIFISVVHLVTKSVNGVGYLIKNVGSNLYLEGSTKKSGDDQLVTLQELTGKDNQRWDLKCNIINVETGRHVTIASTARDFNSKVFMEPIRNDKILRDGETQLFQFTSAKTIKIPWTDRCIQPDSRIVEPMETELKHYICTTSRSQKFTMMFAYCGL